MNKTERIYQLLERIEDAIHKAYYNMLCFFAAANFAVANFSMISI